MIITYNTTQQQIITATTTTTTTQQFSDYYYNFIIILLICYIYINNFIKVILYYIHGGVFSACLLSSFVRAVSTMRSDGTTWRSYLSSVFKMETEYKAFLNDLSHLRDEVIAISAQNTEPQYSGGISVEQNVPLERETKTAETEVG